jgi:protein gp37
MHWGPHAKRRRTSAANWRKPIQWNARHDAFFAQHGCRQRVFCASLADVFDNAVPAEWHSDLFALIHATPNLDWLLLTKRIGNWKCWLERIAGEAGHRGETELRWSDVWAMAFDWLKGRPPSNVWLGATICNQEEADRDIPKLLAVPAAKRFLSVEPMLGPITVFSLNGPIDVPYGDPSPLDWVICGGESGRRARPMHPNWARSLRDQCNAAAVPFFFKQWGEFSYGYDRDRDDPDMRNCSEQSRKPGRWINLVGGHGFHGERVHYADRVGKKAAGRLLDGREWNEVPAYEHD